MKAHRERFAPVDWPADADALARFARDWDDAFRRVGATEAEALAASRWLAARPDPPAYRRDQVPRVVAAIGVLRGPAPPPRVEPGPEERAREEADFLAWLARAEPDRERWRAVVRARFPELAHRPGFVEPLAITWAADPSRVPPPRDPAPAAPPRRRDYPWATGRPEPNVADPAPAEHLGPEPCDGGPAF